MTTFNPIPTGRLAEDEQQRLPVAASFSRGIRSGIGILQDTGQGALAAGQALLGFDDAAQQNLQKIDQRQTDRPFYPEEITSFDQIQSLDDGVRFWARALGEQLPIMTALAAGGGAALGARGLAARLYPSVGKQISPGFAGALGIGTGGSLVETGAIFPEVVEEAENTVEDETLQDLASVAISFGTVAGSIEALPIVKLFDRLGVGKAGRESIQKGILRHASRAGAETALLESGTEALQTVIERSARKFVNENFEIFDKEGLHEITNAAITGGLVGGTIGGAAGAGLGITEKFLPAQGSIERAELEKLRPIENTEEARRELEDTRSSRIYDILYDRASPEEKARLESLKNVGFSDPFVTDEIGVASRGAGIYKEYDKGVYKKLSEAFTQHPSEFTFTDFRILKDILLENNRAKEDIMAHHKLSEPMYESYISLLEDPADRKEGIEELRKAGVSKFKINEIIKDIDLGFGVHKLKPETRNIINNLFDQEKTQKILNEVRLPTDRIDDPGFISDATADIIEYLRLVDTTFHSSDRRDRSSSNLSSIENLGPQIEKLIDIENKNVDVDDDNFGEVIKTGFGIFLPRHRYDWNNIAPVVDSNLANKAKQLNELYTDVDFKVMRLGEAINQHINEHKWMYDYAINRKKREKAQILRSDTSNNYTEEKILNLLELNEDDYIEISNIVKQRMYQKSGFDPDLFINGLIKKIEKDPNSYKIELKQGKLDKTNILNQFEVLIDVNVPSNVKSYDDKSLSQLEIWGKTGYSTGSAQPTRLSTPYSPIVYRGKVAPEQTTPVIYNNPVKEQTENVFIDIPLATQRLLHRNTDETNFTDREIFEAFFSVVASLNELGFNIDLNTLPLNTVIYHTPSKENVRLNKYMRNITVENNESVRIFLSELEYVREFQAKKFNQLTTSITELSKVIIPISRKITANNDVIENQETRVKEILKKEGYESTEAARFDRGVYSQLERFLGFISNHRISNSELYPGLKQNMRELRKAIFEFQLLFPLENVTDFIPNKQVENLINYNLSGLVTNEEALEYGTARFKLIERLGLEKQYDINFQPIEKGDNTAYRDFESHMQEQARFYEEITGHEAPKLNYFAEWMELRTGNNDKLPNANEWTALKLQNEIYNMLVPKAEAVTLDTAEEGVATKLGAVTDSWGSAINFIENLDTLKNFVSLYNVKLSEENKNFLEYLEDLLSPVKKESRKIPHVSVKYKLLNEYVSGQVPILEQQGKTEKPLFSKAGVKTKFKNVDEFMDAIKADFRERLQEPEKNIPVEGKLEKTPYKYFQDILDTVKINILQTLKKRQEQGFKDITKIKEFKANIKEISNHSVFLNDFFNSFSDFYTQYYPVIKSLKAIRDLNRGLFDEGFIRDFKAASDSEGTPYFASILPSKIVNFFRQQLIQFENTRDIKKNANAKKLQELIENVLELDPELAAAVNYKPERKQFSEGIISRATINPIIKKYNEFAKNYKENRKTLKESSIQAFIYLSANYNILTESDIKILTSTNNLELSRLRPILSRINEIAKENKTDEGLKLSVLASDIYHFDDDTNAELEKIEEAKNKALLSSFPDVNGFEDVDRQPRPVIIAKSQELELNKRFQKREAFENEIVDLKQSFVNYKKQFIADRDAEINELQTALDNLEGQLDVENLINNLEFNIQYAEIQKAKDLYKIESAHVFALSSIEANKDNIINNPDISVSEGVASIYKNESVDTFDFFESSKTLGSIGSPMLSFDNSKKSLPSETTSSLEDEILKFYPEADLNTFAQNYNDSINFAQNLINKWSSQIGIAPPKLILFEELFSLVKIPKKIAQNKNYSAISLIQIIKNNAKSNTLGLVLNMPQESYSKMLNDALQIIHSSANNESLKKQLIYIEPELLTNPINKQHLFEIVAHEFGHALLFETLTKQSKENLTLFDNMIAEFDKWSVEVLKQKPIEQAKNAWLPLTFITTYVDFIQDPKQYNYVHGNDTERMNYILNFNEWFANNAAKWLILDRNPKSNIEKFFKLIADLFKKLYQIITKNKKKEDFDFVEHYKFFNSNMVPPALNSVSQYMDSIFHVEKQKNIIYKEKITANEIESLVRLKVPQVVDAVNIIKDKMNDLGAASKKTNNLLSLNSLMDSNRPLPKDSIEKVNNYLTPLNTLDDYGITEQVVNIFNERLQQITPLIEPFNVKLLSLEELYRKDITDALDIDPSSNFISGHLTKTELENLRLEADVAAIYFNPIEIINMSDESFLQAIGQEIANVKMLTLSNYIKEQFPYFNEQIIYLIEQNLDVNIDVVNYDEVDLTSFIGLFLEQLNLSVLEPEDLDKINNDDYVLYPYFRKAIEEGKFIEPDFSEQIDARDIFANIQRILVEDFVSYQNMGLIADGLDFDSFLDLVFDPDIREHAKLARVVDDVTKIDSVTINLVAKTGLSIKQINTFDKNMLMAQQIVNEWANELGIVPPKIASLNELYSDKTLSSLVNDTNGFAYSNINDGSVLETKEQVIQNILNDTEYSGLIGINPSLLLNTHSVDWYMTLAHEFGHILINEVFNDQVIRDRKTANAMVNAYNKWANDQNKEPFIVSDLNNTRLLSQDNYNNSFQEWFAEQTTRWMITNKKPIGIIQKVFRRIANVLKALFQLANVTETFPDSTVSDFFDSIMNYKHYKQDRAESRTFIGDDPFNFGSPGVKINLAIKENRQPNSERTIEIFKIYLDQSFEVKRLFNKIYTSKFVQRQMNLVLKDKPREKENVRKDPNYGLVYMFKLWQAGVIKVTPAEGEVLNSFNGYLESVFGTISDSRIAEDIMLRIAVDNEIQAEDSYKSLMDDIVKNPNRIQRIGRKFVEMYKVLRPYIEAFTQTAAGKMHRTGNPYLIQLANMVDTRAGDNRNIGESMFEAKRAQIGKWINKWHVDIARQFTPEQYSEALELLRDPEKFKNAKKGAPARRLAAAIKNLLHKFRKEYLYPANVNDANANEDYFPIVFNTRYLQDHAVEFKEILVKNEYKEKLQELALTYNVPVREVPDILVQKILNSHGQGDVEYHDVNKTKAPFVTAMASEKLGWLFENNKEDLNKFLNPSLDYIISTYIFQSVKRAEFVRRFGNDGEILLELLAKAKENGATQEDLDIALNFMNAVMGTAGAETNAKLHSLFGKEVSNNQIIHPILQLGIGAAMVIQNMALLSLAVVTSLVDPIGVAVRSGDFRNLLHTLGAGLDEIGSMITGNKTERRLLAESMGTIENRLINEILTWEYGTTWLSPKLKAANETFFKFTGLTAWTRFTRVMALAGAEEFIKRHVKNPNKHSLRYIEELGLSPDDVIIKNGSLYFIDMVTAEKLTEKAKNGDVSAQEELDRDNRMRNALNRFVDESIMRPNATLRPIWASDPHWALVFHLKSFMYSFHDRILRRVASEVGEENFAPLMLLLLFIPGMMMADLLRDLIKGTLKGSDIPTKGLGERAWDSTQRSGVTGLTQLLFDAHKDIQYGGTGLESLSGPALENIVFRADDLMFNNDRGRWEAVQQNLPFGNSLGLIIEGRFLENALR